MGPIKRGCVNIYFGKKGNKNKDFHTTVCDITINTIKASLYSEGHFYLNVTIGLEIIKEQWDANFNI